MNQLPTENIIHAFFEGRANPLEVKLVEEWLAHPENEELFYRYLDAWESQHPQYRPNSERALQEHWQHVAGVAMHPLPATPLRRYNRFGWIAAASVVLLLGMAGIFFRQALLYESHQSAYGEVKSVRLPDGTQVTLNANSVLHVPRWGFDRGDRRVLLEGEAEFNVRHTADHRHFLVGTRAGFEVEVLGTEFVVYTRPRSNRVLLHRGKVRVSYAAGRKALLQPGDLFQWQPQAGQSSLTRVGQTQQYAAWKQHQFYFDNTPLSEVADLVGEHFGLKVSIRDPVTANRRIAGIFKANHANDLLEAVTALLGLEMVKKNDSVELYSIQPN